MAVSLGDAVLAFAGGAAGEYNKEITRQREADQRMLERAQEMMLKQKQRIAETKFATDYEEKVREDRIYKRIQAAGGMESPWGQHVYATEYLGIPQEAAVKMVGSGAGKQWKFEKSERTPEEHMDDLLGNITVETKAGRNRLEGLRREQAKIRERRFSEAPIDDEDIQQMVKGEGIYSSSAFDDYRQIFTPREKIAPFTLKEGETRFGTDSEGNVIELASIAKTDTDKDYTPVESGTYFRNNVTGETIRPVRVGKEYFHGETPIDIRNYTPVTDEDETRRAERISKSVEALKARQTALGNLEAGLTAYKQTLTEGTTGATGVAIDVGSALGATITGVGELLGVDPVTPEEREKLFMEAGVDIEDFISGDMAALRGMNVGQAKQLVYSLAGILKEDGDLARTSVADVQNAASMIKDLSSTDRGVGALRALDYTLQTKKASVFQQTYQAQGVDPRTRTQAGINLLRTTLLKDPKMFEKAKKQIMVDPTTGEMSMLYADGSTRTLDQIIMSEGVSGQLRPTLGVRADYNR